MSNQGTNACNQNAFIRYLPAVDMIEVAQNTNPAVSGGAKHTYQIQTLLSPS